jgi:hypothetical protein
MFGHNTAIEMIEAPIERGGRRDENTMGVTGTLMVFDAPRVVRVT